MARKDTAEPRRAVLQWQLALVLRDIAAGAGRIAKQQEIIAKLDKSGHYSPEAIRKLANLEKEHALNIATHHQIKRELTALNQVSRLRQHRAGKARRKARKVSPAHRSSRNK